MELTFGFAGGFACSGFGGSSVVGESGRFAFFTCASVSFVEPSRTMLHKTL
jgi:hypothetical protein